MDDRTMELACAALEEFLRAKIWGRHGQAVTDFLAHREHRRSPQGAGRAAGREYALAENALASRTGEVPGAVAGAGAAPGRLQELEGEVRGLHDQLTNAQAERDRAEGEARSLLDQLRNAQADITAARTAAQEAQAKLDAQASQRLREQEALLQLQHFLEGVPAGARELVSAYFTLDDLMTFLVQCGQFSRLNQLWEACGKAVTAGEAPDGLAPLLERLLGIFNLASGQNPATLIAPAPGEAYRSEFHFRVNSDGTTVRRLLLPGLRNPGGKMQQPALVELR